MDSDQEEQQVERNAGREKIPPQETYETQVEVPDEPDVRNIFYKIIFWNNPKFCLNFISFYKTLKN